MLDAYLYHYTNATGLRGILESQNIRATHYKFLNDTSECQFLGELVKAKLIDTVEAFIRKENILGADPADEAKNIWEAIEETFHDKSPPFIASFCKHKITEQNDGLLSQWRGYANQTGYCICFDQAMIQANLRTDAIVMPIIEMKYVDASVGVFSDEELHPLIQFAQSMLYAKLGQKSKKSEKACVEFVLENMAKYKHKAFSEENENRIVIFNHQMATSPNLNFRISGDTIIPFELIFAKNKVLPIKFIIVGPGSDQERREQGLKLFLASHPVAAMRNVEVRRSRIPFTSL